MSWLIRGIQSAVFHCASCAPCTGYAHHRKRRKEAKKERIARRKLRLEQPGVYEHPVPFDTNHFWNEEINMGPGPPPRRAKRTNTGGSSQLPTARSVRSAIIGSRSTVVSRDGSTPNFNHEKRELRLSDDTVDDENWNRRLYQREDEYLWGLGDTSSPPRTAYARGSSVGVAGLPRPGTSKSSAESYYPSSRKSPENPYQPPFVNIPSVHPAENHWMLQPPPKASIMSGKERATYRSRSVSGASSRVELNLQREVSARHLRQKLERGETPELPSVSRDSSYSNFAVSPRHDRPKTPASETSSRAKRRRRGTAISDQKDGSSADSTDTVVRLHAHKHGRGSDDTGGRLRNRPSNINSVPETEDLPAVRVTSLPNSPKTSPLPSLKVVRVRSSLQRLSTIISSDSGEPPSQGQLPLGSTIENEHQHAKHHRYSSTQSSDSTPYLMMKKRPALASSDRSSLNVLQDLVPPRELLGSRFVSAPLIEARIRLPPSDREEDKTLSASRQEWCGSGFGFSRPWGNDAIVEDHEASYNDLRDPRMRWSVDF